MKGLLLKDFYMAKKHCWPFLLIIIVFLAVSPIGEGGELLLIYTLLFASLLPVTLLSYDEQAKWDVYSAVLPVSRNLIVSAKYVVGAVFIGAAVVLSGLVQGISQSIDGTFSGKEFWTMLLIFAGIGLICPSLMLPFLFKFGVIKGRFIVIIIFVSYGVFNMAIIDDKLEMFNSLFALSYDNPIVSAGLFFVTTLIIFALSRRLSVYLYENREF